jgi:hypothetical protein
VSGQISSGVIMLGLLFLLPGVLLAVMLAMFMRRHSRFRSWIRIALVLTLLGTGIWIYAVRVQGVEGGMMQIGTMASLVALFSCLLSGIAVWVVPRKKLPVAATEMPVPVEERAIKVKGFDA